MVRKQYPWSRHNSPRTRPKTPAPTAGWLISELSRISGVPVRTLRSYVEQGLIRPIERRGTATRYPRRALLRLLALLRMRATTRWTLAKIKSELDSLGDSELESWLLKSGALSAAAAAALGIASESANANAGAPRLPSPWEFAVAGTQVSTRVDTWHHVELLPGLVLKVSSNASPAVRNAARKICDEFVGPS